MLLVKNDINKKTWESFLENTSLESFPLFQTWQWGEVQEKLGFPVLRIGLYDKDKLIGLCQIIEIHAKRGHYLHVRQGPVLQPFTQKYFSFFLKELIAIAKNKHADFIRISPLVGEDNALVFPKGTINSPIHNMDAQVCWMLDIEGSEETILKGMRKSHRYLIKKASQMPITIVKTAKNDLQDFTRLYKQLATKRHFVPHHGIKQELAVFGEDDMSLLFEAKFEGKVIVVALIDFVGNMAIYRHSASDEQYKHIPAMYLLQWEVIKEAKKRGKKIYNFWGIAENEHKNHPWYGLTLFKTGFGGRRKEFMHAKDIPLTLIYAKTYLIDYLTKLVKGY